MARRQYQIGSVFKRGKRRKVWVGRWREDVIENGELRPVQRSKVLGFVRDLTKAQARMRLGDILQRVNERSPRYIVTFRRFAEDWEASVLPNFKFSTRRSYRLYLKKHLIPHFGEMQLAEIGGGDVQVFLTEKAGTYAGKTVRHMRNLLSGMFRTAQEWGYAQGNPALGVKLPEVQRKEGRFLSRQSMRLLLAELSEPVRTMVLLAVLTGLRRGELFGLRWKNVDLEAGVLRVREAVYEGHFGTPKTKSSVRDVPLGPEVVAVLQKLPQRGPETLVFPSRRGTALDPNNLLKRVIRPACERAGIPYYTWKDFRDTHATLLHDSREPLKIAQAQLGHSNLETTLQVYTHPVPESQRRAVEKLERVLFPSVPKFEESVH